jgi:hypothetical protein
MSRTKPYSRTIPHPLFERLIVEDAMKMEKDSWKPERPHEYIWYPSGKEGPFDEKFPVFFCFV